MHKTFFIITIFIFLFFSSCTSLPYPITDNQGSGLAMVYVDDIQENNLENFCSAHFFVENNLLERFNFMVDSEKKCLITQLPPGEYIISKVDMLDYTGRVFDTFPDISISFIIESGTVTILPIKVVTNQTLLGITYTQYISIDYIEESDRNFCKTFFYTLDNAEGWIFYN
jgi:hypothetical protein